MSNKTILNLFSIRMKIILFSLFFITTSMGDNLDKANEFYAQGKYPEAIRLYKKAVLDGANPAICHFNCANAYFQIDSIPQAIVYYKSTIANAPDFFRGYLNLATAYYTLDDMGQCIAILKRALEIEPDNIQAQKILAESYRQVGALPEAAVIFQQILANSPGDEDIYIALGEIFRDLDDPESSINWLSRYPSTGKNHAYVFQILANIYEQQENYEKSLYYLQQVFQLKPTQKWIFYKTIEFLQKMGNDFVAFEEAKKGVRLFPKFAELALVAGNLAFKQEYLNEAEKYYLIAKSNGSAGAIVGLENVKIMRENTKKK